MPLLRLFPTQVWTASLRVPPDFNRDVLRECRGFRSIDAEGQAWSRESYPEGYTSYASIDDLPYCSPTFDVLRRLVDREVAKYARALELDLGARRLRMTKCWLNVMGRHCSHGFHLHPLAVISGSYYVRVPRGASMLKLEDPRIAAFMASPQRRPDATRENQRYVSVPVAAGDVVLFESWLKHEVPANRVKQERVSVSFNYEWT